MPCRWPDDSELYRLASHKLARQKWINRKNEEVLCDTSTLLMQILLNPNNVIELSENFALKIQTIKTNHLKHRTEELKLQLQTKKKEEKRAQEIYAWFVQTRVERESQWFTANKTHAKKESESQENIRVLQEQIFELEHILKSLENKDPWMIEKVLTKTQ